MRPDLNFFSKIPTFLRSILTPHKSGYSGPYKCRQYCSSVPYILKVFQPWGDSSSSQEFSVHTLDHSLGKKYAINTTALRGVSRVKGNLADFMIENFMYFSAYKW